MNNWRKVRLGDILTESKEVADYSDGNLRLRVLLNARGVIKRPLTKEKSGATKYFTRKAGQFIYGKQNLHKGAFGIVPEALNNYTSTSDLPAFDIDKSCLPEWLLYFFKQGGFYLSLVEIASGAATKRIQPKVLFDVEILLPSTIEEQQLIVKQFDKIEESQKELKSEILIQKQLISQLKQSILQDAIQGELTKDWRKENPTVEPATELLKRIKAEKAQLVKEKKIKKEKPLPAIAKEEIPFELPEGWSWCRLGDVLLYSDSGKSPKCETRPASNGEVGVLTTTSIQENLFDELANKVLPSTFEINETHLIEIDDVLITRAGPLNRTGVACKVAQLSRKLILSDKTIRLKHPENLINPDYLCTTLNSLPIRALLIPNMTGMAQSQVNISQKNIKLTQFPLPPLEEQKAIVQKIETLLQKCTALEQEIAQSEANAEMLMQAVLKEAFEKKGEKEVE